MLHKLRLAVMDPAGAALRGYLPDQWRLRPLLPGQGGCQYRRKDKVLSALVDHSSSAYRQALGASGVDNGRGSPGRVM